ncbi:hypothetical protein MTO96_049814 [Rhipicephalus appendiculatus]
MKNIALAFVSMGHLVDAVTSLEYIMAERADFRTALHLVVCQYHLAAGSAVGSGHDKVRRSFLKLLDVAPDQVDDKYEPSQGDPAEMLYYEEIKNDSLQQIERERRLWQLAHDLNFSLLTDPTQPTRIGNSVCRDTTPDLSFCRSVRDARWSNTHQSLGSDHYVLTIQVITSLCKPRQHTARHTDWDAFRERRLHSRLAHLWAARTGLTNRWHKQRHNRRLRRRIAHLDRTIEQHTTVLARQQWEQLCSELSGQLGCKQSWHLLRHLLDPASAKSVARQQLQRVVRAYPGDTPSLMADLAAKYFQLLTPGVHSPPLARHEAEWCISTAAKLIAPVISSSFSEGYEWCLEQIKSSAYAYIANDLEISKAVAYLRKREFNQAIDTLKAFEKKGHQGCQHCSHEPLFPVLPASAERAIASASSIS